MYKDLVFSILEITDYKEDKEEFGVEFNRIVNSQALVALMQTLDADKQKEADELIAKADSPEAFTQAVNTYFTTDQVQAALDNAAAQAISQWISSLAPTLNDEQREKLVALSEKLQKAMDTSKKAN